MVDRKVAYWAEHSAVQKVANLVALLVVHWAERMVDHLAVTLVESTVDLKGGWKAEQKAENWAGRSAGLSVVNLVGAMVVHLAARTAAY